MNTKKTKFIYWLYTFAFAIFSLLLVAYAYDISKGETIAPSSTQQYKQDLLITIATVLGFKGSIALGILATGASLFYTIKTSRLSNK